MTYKFKINLDSADPTPFEVSEEQSRVFLDWAMSDMPSPGPPGRFTRDAEMFVWKRWVPRFVSWLLMRLPNSGWAHRIQKPFLVGAWALRGVCPKQYTTKDE